MDENTNGVIATLINNIKENWRLIAVGIIILAIALNSSWSGDKSSEENKSETTNQTEQTEQNKSEEKTQNTENGAINTAQAQETKTTNAITITEVAARSEGITHLARRAIKEYSENNGVTLNAEQKIYTEDYLSKKTGTKILEVGEEVEFSAELINQGIEKAQGLSQKQIENLSKYVPLVTNLN